MLLNNIDKPGSTLAYNILGRSTQFPVEDSFYSNIHIAIFETKNVFYADIQM